MTIDQTSQLAAAGGGFLAGTIFGLPNPIAAAVYALIAAVVGWLTAYVLNALKRRLGL